MVKPKCVWEAVVQLKNCKQTAETCEPFFLFKKSSASKHILALSTLGPKCTVSDLQPFDNFLSEHPVNE